MRTMNFQKQLFQDQVIENLMLTNSCDPEVLELADAILENENEFENLNLPTKDVANIVLQSMLDWKREKERLEQERMEQKR